MANDVQYRRCLITARSYESGAGGWRPKALVVTPDGSSPRAHYVFWAGEATFRTRAEADAQAVEMAKRWIDDCAW